MFFTDKNGSTFDPYTYFAPEAITRRLNLGISLYDSTDFPVCEKYIAEITKRVTLVGHTTRWFNGVGVEANEEQIVEVRKLSFVREVVEQSTVIWKPASTAISPDTTQDGIYDLKRSVDLQIDPMAGKVFQQNNLTGKGIIISIIDVGFHGVDVHPAFQSLRFNNGIRSTFDFAKDDADVYKAPADHGTMVLSCIAGFVNGKAMGLAPDATFLLAKIATSWTSQPKGEENFVAAMEWSDKQGAMLINCSDGPNYESYLPEQMNGKVSLMSRASNMAAGKGILVIAAAGNEGESSSPVLLPPADADSVLSVTALNDRGYIASYSSIGPTPDFRHKPDVCAPGTVLVANGFEDYEESEGTSFSSPLLVGFAACVIQKYPDLSPMQLMDTLHKCSSLYPYYDYAHGYGTPQASYFFDTTSVQPKTFSLVRSGNSVSITIDEKFVPVCGADLLPKLFYSLEDEQGRIYRYYVYELVNGNQLSIPETQLRQGVKVNVFYYGYYESLQL
ncbi:MAG: S8 family serine peptidase [Bacteroidota bacterium]|nr:S8 family serine peptidase [Bacteroidota bacterium]